MGNCIEGDKPWDFLSQWPEPLAIIQKPPLLAISLVVVGGEGSGGRRSQLALLWTKE